MTGGGSGLAPLLLGAGAGGLLAVAAREALLASPAAVEWVRLALEPLMRAGREGYSPSTPERRKLAVLGAGSTIAGGWFVGGAAVALPLAVAGPGLAAWAISSRRARYRAAVERALPAVAAAIADSLTAGRTLRASFPAAATSLDGPPAVELARLGAELDLGAPTADAIARIETLALMAGVGLPHEAIAEQARRGLDLVVQIERRIDGGRRVTEIAEVER